MFRKSLYATLKCVGIWNFNIGKRDKAISIILLTDEVKPIAVVGHVNKADKRIAHSWGDLQAKEAALVLPSDSSPPNQHIVWVDL